MIVFVRCLEDGEVDQTSEFVDHVSRQEVPRVDSNDVQTNVTGIVNSVCASDVVTQVVQPLRLPTTVRRVGLDQRHDGHVTLRVDQGAVVTLY